MARLSHFLSLGFRNSSHQSRTTAFRFYCPLHNNPNALPKRPGPLTQYKALVDQGKLQHDRYQETIASELENLVKKLEQYDKEMEDYHVSLSKWEETRENERRRILVEEAEVKQEGGAMASVKKSRSRIFENLMSWKDNANGYVLQCHRRNCETSQEVSLS